MAGRDSMGEGRSPVSIFFAVAIGLVQLWLVAMVLILGAAFVMGILGANTDASFTSWIYARTEDIMRPFDGIFDPIQITDETQIRTSLLFAMLVYGALAAVAAGISRRFSSHF